MSASTPRGRDPGGGAILPGLDAPPPPTRMPDMLARIAIAAALAAGSLASPGCDAPGTPAGPAGQTGGAPQLAAARFFDAPAFGVEMDLALGPHPNRIRVDLPETLSARRGALAFAPFRGLPGSAAALPGGYRAASPSAEVEGGWRLAGDFAELELSVTHRGLGVAEDVRSQVCLRLAEAPSFLHPGARGVWITENGAPLEFSELRARDGYPASAVIVGRRGGEPDPPGVRREQAIFSRSNVRADDGVIAVRSADGRFSLGTLWQDARLVFHNFTPGRQCIHSNPSFGSLRPGETATRKGWIVLVEGGPELARQRLLELERSASGR